MHRCLAHENDGPSGRSSGASLADDGQRQGRLRPLDRVNRQFHAPAPNRLWVSDFTYVSTWTGWSMSPSSSTSMPASSWVGASAERHMPALCLMPWNRPFMTGNLSAGDLVHHSDRGSQYLSISIPSGWPRLASNLRSAVSVTATTTRSPKRSPDLYKAEVILTDVTLAFLRGRRVRNIGMGRLVKSQGRCFETPSATSCLLKPRRITTQQPLPWTLPWPHKFKPISLRQS